MIRFRASARWRWLRKGVGRENYLTLIPQSLVAFITSWP